MMMDGKARAATLDELTQSVPRTLRAEWPIQWSDDGQHETGHCMAPVGEYIHKQREEIERLQRELAEARRERDEAQALLTATRNARQSMQEQRGEARAELAALKSAGVALRDDMLMRARIRAEFEGREVPTVDASDGIWMSFCAALGGEE